MLSQYKYVGRTQRLVLGDLSWTLSISLGSRIFFKTSNSFCFPAPLYRALWNKYLETPPHLVNSSGVMPILDEPSVVKLCDMYAWRIKLKIRYSTKGGKKEKCGGGEGKRIHTYTCAGSKAETYVYTFKI